jgi:hypothetical protein
VASLIERTQSLSARVHAFKTLRDEANAAVELQARWASIAAMHSKLAALGAVRKLLIKYDITVKRQPKPSAALTNKAESLRQLFNQDPLSLTRESAQFGPTFNKPLQEFITKLEGALLDRWQSYVDDKLPTINERLLETFSTMGFSTEVAKVKASLAQAKSLREILPTHSDTLSRVDKLAGELNSVWRSLDEIPADVRRFFRLAANHEAKLEDLTDPIRDWLNAHGLIGMLRVGLAR